MKRKYWFKIWVGKWDKEDNFEPEDSYYFVEAWDVAQAIRKTKTSIEIEDKEVITNVIYLGFDQL